MICLFLVCLNISLFQVAARFQAPPVCSTCGVSLGNGILCVFSNFLSMSLLSQLLLQGSACGCGGHASLWGDFWPASTLTVQYSLAWKHTFGLISQWSEGLSDWWDAVNPGTALCGAQCKGPTVSQSVDMWLLSWSLWIYGWIWSSCYIIWLLFVPSGLCLSSFLAFFKVI